MMLQQLFVYSKNEYICAFSNQCNDFVSQLYTIPSTSGLVGGFTVSPNGSRGLIFTILGLQRLKTSVIVTYRGLPLEQQILVKFSYVEIWSSRLQFRCLGLSRDTFKGQITLFHQNVILESLNQGKMARIGNILELQKLFLYISLKKHSKWPKRPKSQKAIVKLIP